MDVLIRRCDAVIDVSRDGVQPLPTPLLDALRETLAYTYRREVHGASRCDQTTGWTDSVQIERLDLCVLDSYGKLCTGYGFTAKITNFLRNAGCQVHFEDRSPPRSRPNCYEPDWENLRRHFMFRPRQEECLARITQTVGGIVNAPTGFGKTRLFNALAHLYPHARIAIVTKSMEVAHKIRRRLIAEFAGVGQYGGGVRQRGDRIVVFVAKSMHYTDEDFDFLFCDEVHQLMAPDLSEKLGSYFVHTRNFGFTATPEGRLDGADAKLEMFFGPQIFSMTYKEAERLGLVVPIRVRWVPVWMQNGINPARGKRTRNSRLRWGIWRNQERNAAIAADFRSHYDASTQVLMAVSTVEHAIFLWQHLPEFTLCHGEIEEERFDGYKRAGLLPENFQSMTAERRDMMRTAFEEQVLKRVIATDIWSTGVDFEGLQVLYRCDARESPILDAQWPGRVSRIYEGKGCGEVIDLVDRWDESFLRKSRTRKNHYDDYEWSQDWPRGRRQSNVV